MLPETPKIDTTYGIMKGGNLPRPEATNGTWQDVTSLLVKVLPAI